MHRTEGSNNVVNLFSDGPPPTTVEENWLNAVQEELINIIEDVDLVIKTAATDTRDQLKDAIKRKANQYFIAKDVKAANTAGGTWNAGAWTARTLNTYQIADSLENDGAGLAANKITLPAGDYCIFALVPGYNISTFQARLYDTTGASALVLGTTHYSSASVNEYSQIMGVFTLAVESELEIQMRSTGSRITDGAGVQSNLGVDEVYTQVEINKIAD